MRFVLGLELNRSYDPEAGFEDEPTEEGRRRKRKRRSLPPEATLAELGAAPGQASPNSTLRSSVQQGQPCQLHDCSRSRQLVTVLPPPPVIHRREEILVVPQHLLGDFCNMG
jgi:hypothetical protein